MEEFLKWLQQNLPKHIFWLGIGFVLLLLGGSRIAELLLQLKQLRATPNDPKDAELRALEREVKIANLKAELANKGLALPSLPSVNNAPTEVKTETAAIPNHAMSWLGLGMGSAEPAMRPINRLPRFLRIPIAIVLVMLTGSAALLMLIMTLSVFWMDLDNKGIVSAIISVIMYFALAMTFSYVAFEAANRIRGDK